MKSIYFILFILSSIISTAQVKIGDHPTILISPNSTTLELEATTKAILLTRVVSVDLIATPINGMMVYDISNRCMRGYEDGGWSDCYSGVKITATIPGNDSSINKFISKTSCSKVFHATINDDPLTTLGIEYDWSAATSTLLGEGFGAPTNTRSLVEIGGQCWAKFNSNIVNANRPVSPSSDVSDVGVSAYYTGGPFPNEGLLYQWSAAMNGTLISRSQGVCPTAWHIPSDVEWMYLENSLGMTTTDQQVDNAYRGSGTVGSSLSTQTFQGNNNSGFTALLTGYIPYNTATSTSRTFIEDFWSSTAINATQSISRVVSKGEMGVFRGEYTKTSLLSVRCLKD